MHKKSTDEVLLALTMLVNIDSIPTTAKLGAEII